MEDCETGVLGKTGCRAKERDQELQDHCAHICLFEVVRILYYYSARDKFERLRGREGEFGINEQIRIRFSSLRIFFERFEFLVCSCACAVACLYPRNSISNVVASVTIHDDMFVYIYIFIFIRDVFKKSKNMKPLWKVKGFLNGTSWKVSDVQIVRYTCVLLAKDKSNHPVADPLLSVHKESWS